MRSVGAAAVTAGLLFVPLASAATFGRPAEIPLVRAPVSVEITDATQDGSADIVLANSSGPVLTLLPGRRDGSFERPLNVGTGTQPRSLAISDFDNDGGDEVAVAGGSEIDLYAGVDASLVRRSVTPARSPLALATADLDSDGNLDLIAGSATDALVSVFAGLGDGTFASPREYAIRSPATSLLAADLNSDDLPDVAASGDGVSILSVTRTGRCASISPGPASPVRALLPPTISTKTASSTSRSRMARTSSPSSTTRATSSS